jgi:serine phosphatase RsbU (regulator of sigma subunit)
LFSDGATEIQNAENEWLGISGFTQILKALDYPKKPLRMETLEEKLLKFSNDIRLQDDITIIEARYLVRIPLDSGRRFRSKPATHSD